MSLVRFRAVVSGLSNKKVVMPSSLEAMVSFVATAEKMLESRLMTFQPIGPICLVVRDALIREIALGDQIVAALRDGATLSDCRGIYDKLKSEHRIVSTGISQLKG